MPALPHPSVHADFLPFCPCHQCTSPPALHLATASAAGPSSPAPPRLRQRSPPRRPHHASAAHCSARLTAASNSPSAGPVHAQYTAQPPLFHPVFCIRASAGRGNGWARDRRHGSCSAIVQNGMPSRILFDSFESTSRSSEALPSILVPHPSLLHPPIFLSICLPMSLPSIHLPPMHSATAGLLNVRWQSGLFGLETACIRRHSD